jgi:hypothetical protein
VAGRILQRVSPDAIAAPGVEENFTAAGKTGARHMSNEMNRRKSL